MRIHVAIATPEGVDLEVELGGLGSRFIATLLDTGLKGIVILAVGLVLGVIGSGVATAIFYVLKRVRDLVRLRRAVRGARRGAARRASAPAGCA